MSADSTDRPRSSGIIRSPPATLVVIDTQFMLTKCLNGGGAESCIISYVYYITVVSIFSSKLKRAGEFPKMPFCFLSMKTVKAVVDYLVDKAKC